MKRRTFPCSSLSAGMVYRFGGAPLVARTRPRRPNILFCIADDQSYQHAGAYGCRWVRTPGFDRVAREGLLFTRAYTPNANCAPSRSCLLTRRNPWQLEAAAILPTPR
jgi:N-sulfoglucosamine sulfohydrolase